MIPSASNEDGAVFKATGEGGSVISPCVGDLGTPGRWRAARLLVVPRVQVVTAAPGKEKEAFWVRGGGV